MWANGWCAPCALCGHHCESNRWQYGMVAIMFVIELHNCFYNFLFTDNSKFGVGVVDTRLCIEQHFSYEQKWCMAYGWNGIYVEENIKIQNVICRRMAWTQQKFTACVLYIIISIFVLCFYTFIYIFSQIEYIIVHAPFIFQRQFFVLSVILVHFVISYYCSCMLIRTPIDVTCVENVWNLFCVYFHNEFLHRIWFTNELLLYSFASPVFRSFYILLVDALIYCCNSYFPISYGYFAF